jgi:hypothetical protein
MTVKGAYFVSNDGPGIDATSGITLVQGTGFENNQGAGAIVQGSATFSGDTFSTYGPQMTGIGGYLAGGQVTVIGDLAEYYGPGSPALVLANVQGQGTLAVAGNGAVVVGPKVAVTGGAGPLTTVIEASGATTLVRVGNDYLLYPVGGSSGPALSYNGAPVTVGEFGSWTPIGAEQTASGYQVAWQFGTADQYIAWTADSSGQWLSQGTVLSGASVALESLEPSFHQDLNGDGTIGLKTTVIEASGATTLDRVANTYFLYATGTTTGPQLKMSGAAVTVGQFGLWTPLGAEQVASGYQVVWKNGPADQYIVWNTDGSGNFLSQGAVLSAASAELQSLEPGFNQDLNNSGAITPRTVIESFGSTTLAKIANAFVLSATGSSLGPQLKMSGALVMAGQFGAWTPIAGEQTTTGYQVAWKNGAADQYIVWDTDSSGNFLSQGAVVSGSSSTLKSFESSFHQDLNGDGVIGSTTPMMSSNGSAAETSPASSGTLNLALFTNYMASVFVTPAGEGTGVVVEPQSSLQSFLAKPLA